ncbi:hypothetical protein [Lacrimispora celerecrescens]|uniref:DUF3168 domain-containing protein n=1 Tax=[Clostridium] celerecrescens 18A TaxID=1286362 RepID=A0A2M8Z310_9FIRM|nr:hypothetical protein [Lacrimispora celerecrescens]PJJ27834.1 hypothetical protein H171_1314 [[Clostridium] celerecrescens 18A]
MLDISSLVYTRLVNDETLKKYIKGSGTTRNDTPSAFPYLYFKSLGQPTTSSSLQNKQCAISADFEIIVYDSGSFSKAKQLIFLAADIMTELGFTLKFGPLEVDRSNTTEAYRWIARFHRTYCEGDLI